jgi:MOSC domain-containing protein YiiM
VSGDETDRPRGRVTGLYVAPEASAPMRSLDRVEAVPGGLCGDRYRRGDGHFALDACEVTLVGAASLAVAAGSGVDLSGGRHRRNVVVAGLDPADLVGARIAVGGADLRVTRPRPPCAHLESLTEAGAAAALREGGGGACADVVAGGTVAVDDPVRVIEAAPRAVGRAIADRLRGRATADRDGHPES